MGETPDLCKLVYKQKGGKSSKKKRKETWGRLDRSQLPVGANAGEVGTTGYTQKGESSESRGSNRRP